MSTLLNSTPVVYSVTVTIVAAHHRQSTFSLTSSNFPDFVYNISACWLVLVSAKIIIIILPVIIITPVSSG